MNCSPARPVCSAEHAALLSEACRSLYGENGKGELAQALVDFCGDEYVNKRRVQHWCAGSRPIPQWVWEGVAELIRERSEAFPALLREIEPLALRQDGASSEARQR